MPNNSTKQPTSWRDVIKVHPAAYLFPMMTPDELKALGEDIKKNGLKSPIAITISKTPGGKWEYQLLDGRNRLDAMEAVGLPLTISLNNGQCRITTKAAVNILGLDTYDGVPVRVIDDDPYAYVISANLHRRHLTPEDKQDLIAKVLKAQPEKSNRNRAASQRRPQRSARFRRKLEATGEVSPVDKTTGKDGKARTTAPKKKRRDVEDYIAEKKAKTTAKTLMRPDRHRAPQQTNSAESKPTEFENSGPKALHRTLLHAVETANVLSNWGPISERRQKQIGKQIDTVRAALSELVRLFELEQNSARAPASAAPAAPPIGDELDIPACLKRT